METATLLVFTSSHTVGETLESCICIRENGMHPVWLGSCWLTKTGKMLEKASIDIHRWGIIGSSVYRSSILISRVGLPKVPYHVPAGSGYHMLVLNGWLPSCWAASCCPNSSLCVPFSSIHVQSGFRYSPQSVVETRPDYIFTEDHATSS